jgi:hypothetical protein
VSSVDSNYATDKGDRRSVSGGLHTLGGMITNWNCTTQKSVTLSSTEAECVSMAKGLQETLFSQMLLKEIAHCELSAVMLEDNTGAIFLVKNQQVGTRTKHIDVRCHFLREHFEKKHFNVKFVRSEDNESAILTKNAPERLLKTHAVNIRNGAMNTWMNHSEHVNTVHAVWRENVKIDESNESWVEVCQS